MLIDFVLDTISSTSFKIRANELIDSNKIYVEYVQKQCLSIA